MRSAKKVVFIILWSPLRLALPNANLKLDSYIYTRYQVWFYLWWIKPKLRLCCKVPKYYAEDCNSVLLPTVSRKFVFKYLVCGYYNWNLLQFNPDFSMLSRILVLFWFIILVKLINSNISLVRKILRQR